MQSTALAYPSEAAATLRPSEYTAALIQTLRRRAAWVRGADVLEIGCGSGVVLAAAGALGAVSLCGVDIESDAVWASAVLLRELGHGDKAELHHGDLWRPVSGRRFDLILANLPEFPMQPGSFGGRLSTWSSGGEDGRRLLDPFLEGLAEHLAPGGRAIATHNGFVDLARSRRIVERHGLTCRVADTAMIPIVPDKLALMTPAALRAAEGRSIHRYGPHAFGEVHVVEIGVSNNLD